MFKVLTGAEPGMDVLSDELSTLIQLYVTNCLVRQWEDLRLDGYAGSLVAAQRLIHGLVVAEADDVFDEITAERLTCEAFSVEVETVFLLGDYIILSGQWEGKVEMATISVILEAHLVEPSDAEEMTEYADDPTWTHG